jgi:Serine phosphatase RsbU, regulator of sigma subunit
MNSENQFENIIRSVQYIMRITPQQDVYENISQVVAKYFGASWVTFASFSQQEKKYMYYGMTPRNGFQENFHMDIIEKVVSNVLDSGFLAFESFSAQQPAQLVFLPLREQENIQTVMIIGHEGQEKLPKSLVNTYLALGELSSTAIEIRKHRSNLEEMIFERTKELKLANNLLKQVNERNNKELTIANTFQTSLMPGSKRFETVDMFGKYIPCSMVGGDLYDCVASGDSLWFIIADVAGHGLVAAMISTMVKGMFNECIRNSVYPNEILEKINEILCTMYNSMDSYLVSAFIGVIREDCLFYSNAGHPYPVIIDPENKDARIIKQNGCLLGMDPGVKYQNGRENIHKGEMIILYTDGFIDSNGCEDSDLEQIISECSLKEYDLFKKNPSAFIDHLVDSLANDKGKALNDDASIVVISKK